MTDIPIIFSGPMVRALLDGRKTMTRRLLKPQPEQARDSDGKLLPHGIMHLEGEPRPRIVVGRVITKQELRYAVGDRLWVRENLYYDWKASCWRYRTDTVSLLGTVGRRELPRPTPDRWPQGVCNSIHMPRWASRLTLTVTATKVEWLQDITPADAMAEGVERRDDRDYQIGADIRGTDPIACFSALWWSLHGIGTWDQNPEVVALTFTVHKQNIDALPKAEAA